jgi:hypothetical protein
MSAQASLSAPPTTPAGAKAGCAAPSTLLLLFIIRLLIAWAEGVAASLRERTETTDLTDITRAFGTTDVAQILERVTIGLQRLRALEDMILRSVPGLASDPQRNIAATDASPRGPSLSLQPASAALLSCRSPGRITAPPNRATGPPRIPGSIRKVPTGPVHPLLRRGMAGPVMPIPLLRTGMSFD